MKYRSLLAAVLGACLFAAPVFAQSPLAGLPLVGTGGHGHAYPGATVPFGMVQLSPDTPMEGWDGCSGYHYSDSVINGFSHTHLSGTGCGCLGDVLLMPTVGAVHLDAGKPGNGYASRFSHQQEEAVPGYYRVYLQDPQVTAELTATPRCGFHKYTFPATDQAHVILDLVHGIGNDVVDAEIKVEGADTISGYRISDGWGGRRAVYFVMQFSKPFASFGIEENGTRLAADKQEAHARHLKAFVNYQTTAGETVLVKVGISGTGVDGARKNLQAEIGGWDFAAATTAAEAQWQRVFDKVEITALNPQDRATFYANLYLTCLAPVLFNDVDGSYRGMDHKNHPGAAFQNYTTFSIWDIYRAEWPLMTLLHPDRVDDMVQSMLAEYDELGQHTTPIWPLWGNETWCMIGYHSVDMISEAYLEGFRGFDPQRAFAAVKDTAMQDRNGLRSYKERGYVASRPGDQATSKTLEYTFDDWSIARMAEALGHTDDAQLFYQRSANYRNLFDRTTRFFRGRKANGDWRYPFVANALVGDEYTEADAWQYAFGVQHDVPGMIALYGGDAGFIEKLDALFTEDSTILTGIPDITGLIGQYSQGDEQCHHVAYLYDYVGQPYKTQQRVRQALTTLFNDTPEGQCGNVDCGQMSACYVFGAIGLYPMNPLSGIYAIGSPLVSQATIHLDQDKYHGHTFTVAAKNNSTENIYIQSATLNGKPLNRPWLTRDEIIGGGTLALDMGPKPNPQWGSATTDRPPTTMPADFKYAALPEPASTNIIPLPFPIRVICGGGDAVGGFVPDPNMITGGTSHSDHPVDTQGVTNAAPAEVYQGECYGQDFAYTFAVPPGGSYLVRLHFAEMFDGDPGMRIENVDINGQPVLTNFEVFAAAGGMYKAVVKEFPNITPDAKGNVTIRFYTKDNSPDRNAKVSGIEILKAGAAGAAAPFVTQTADGKCTISIDTSGAPNLKEWAETKLAPVLAEWYPKFVGMMGSDGFTAPTNFSVTIKPVRGVAFTSGTAITGNSDWLESQLKGEAVGSLVHEMVHVVQQYGWGRQHNPDATRSPGWLVEGLTDYMRWFKYEPDSHGADLVWLKRQRQPKLEYDGSYRITANFLDWVVNHYDADLIAKLNTAMREGRYDESIWQKATGKPVQELAAEWQKSIEAELQPAAAGK